MSDSPYSRVGARLVDMGFSAIPILPNAKRPGSYSKGRWWGMDDWQRFCDRSPTSIETDIWSTWPNAGVGVALGPASGGLAAVDIDCDKPEIIAAVQKALPDESPVQKIGKRGYTAFYRARPCVITTSYDINGDRAVDLLCRGRQSVLPHTIHPDTGRPYSWLTMATLEDTTTDRLPLLPDDIAARIGAALSPFGFFAPVERPPVDGDGGIWREVNEVALERFSDWVPHLGIDAKQLSNGNWRGVALWRDGEDRNVGFSPQGIRDFVANTGHTAIDTVMLSHNSDFPTADKWLRERLGFKDPPPVVFTFRKPADPEPTRAPIEVPLGTPEPKLDPWDHKVAGGLLEQTAAWVMETSFLPSRELSLMAAIAIMCAFIGRRYVGPTGLAPNLYLVGLGGTGSGKDAPLTAVVNLFTKGGGMEHMLGAGDYTSDSAIERKVREKPSCVSPMDEIGAWLMGASAKNSPMWAKDRRSTLLKLYSNSKVTGTYMGKDRAVGENMSSNEPMVSPCFSLFGVSTPDLFFKGITDENSVDGFLNRLTLVHIPPTGAIPNWDTPIKEGIPLALKDAYNDALLAWPCPAARKGDYRKSTATPFLYPVPFANQEVKERLIRVWQWQEDTIRESETSSDQKRLTAGLVRRTVEQTLKLALIRAVSRDFARPEVTVDDINFGNAIVNSSINMLNDGMHDYRSGSDFEDHHKTLLRRVNEAGDKGLTNKALRCRAGVSKINTRDYDAAVKYLTDTGGWEARKATNGVRYVALGGRVAVERD